MTTAQRTNAAEAFEMLQAQYAAVYERFCDERYSQMRKYGDPSYIVRATKGEREKLDRLKAKLDRYTDRMLRLLDALSPATDNPAQFVTRESETLWRITSDRSHDLGRVVEIIEDEDGLS